MFFFWLTNVQIDGCNSILDLSKKKSILDLSTEKKNDSFILDYIIF